MARWTIDEPIELDFDGVVALRANIMAGSVSVLPTADRPSLHVSEISGQPLEIVHEAGMLTINHKDSGVEGLVKWLRNTRGRVNLTVCVPCECPVRLNLATANAVVTGITGRVSVKTASGDVTLDGVTGAVDANTASGSVEAQGLDGQVNFNSVSGDLSLAGGTIRRLQANSVTGRVTADVALRDDGGIHISTVAGEVTLRLPASVSATARLYSATGRVDSAFPGLGPRDRAMGKNLTGSIGDGGAPIGVNTISGAITLLRRSGETALEGDDDQ